MAHRVSPQAESDLDDIWLYVAKDCGSMEIATRLIDSITDRFTLLANFPYAGRVQRQGFGPGIRSFPVGEFLILYCIEDANVFILRVVHGRRELAFLIDSF